MLKLFLNGHKCNLISPGQAEDRGLPESVLDTTGLYVLFVLVKFIILTGEKNRKITYT